MVIRCGDTLMSKLLTFQMPLILFFDFDASNVIFMDLTSEALKLFDFDASDVIFMDLMLEALKFFEVSLTKKRFRLKFL